MQEKAATGKNPRRRFAPRTAGGGSPHKDICLVRNGQRCNLALAVCAQKLTAAAWALSARSWVERFALAAWARLLWVRSPGVLDATCSARAARFPVESSLVALHSPEVLLPGWPFPGAPGLRASPRSVGEIPLRALEPWLAARLPHAISPHALELRASVRWRHEISFHAPEPWCAVRWPHGYSLRVPELYPSARWPHEMPPDCGRAPRRALLWVTWLAHDTALRQLWRALRRVL